MSEIVAVITPPIDRSLFSLHPEEEMTERQDHAEQLEYFKFALRRTLPDLYVARNMAVYWIPGQMQEPWAGPDIFVSRHHPQEEVPSCYLTYQEGPLAFVCEVASPKTRGKEADRRDKTYAQALTVPEHLFIDLRRHVLELSELVSGRYVRIAPDAAGRHWSRELGIGLVWQPDERLVRVVTATGEVVPTGQEETAQRYEAEAREWQKERQRAEAEARATREARQRAEAETRATDEARQRAEAEARAAAAEARAAEESRQRAAAEAREEALAAEVARLRREVDAARDVPPSQ
jgi:Putative restriction endonuclease